MFVCDIEFMVLNYTKSDLNDRRSLSDSFRIDLLFTEIDLNDDNHITFDEFTKFLHDFHPRTFFYTCAVKNFDALDNDSDNT